MAPKQAQDFKIAKGSNPAAVPKPATSKEKSEPPYTGWDGPIPSSEGGNKEEDFYHKPPYEWNSEHFKAKYTATCFCGRVAFEIAGDPIGAKYCHCKQCQKLHGAPFQHAVMFFKTSVRITKNEGGKNLNFFSTGSGENEHNVPCKVSCSHCHSNLFDEGRNMVLAYPSAFDFPGGGNGLPEDFHPDAHIFYESRSMDICDGVPKWTKHANGSELMEEASAEAGVMGKAKRGQREHDKGNAPHPKRHHKSDEEQD